VSQPSIFSVGVFSVFAEGATFAVSLVSGVVLGVFSLAISDADK
jgi:hypothetical protein